MKLVTTYAALELLGPAYRWKTEAYLRRRATWCSRATATRSSTTRASGCCCATCAAAGCATSAATSCSTAATSAPVANGPHRRRQLPAVQRGARRAAGQLQVAALQLRSGRARRAGLSPSRALPGLEVVNTLKLAEGACPEGRAFRDLHPGRASRRSRRAPRSPAPTRWRAARRSSTSRSTSRRNTSRPWCGSSGPRWAEAGTARVRRARLRRARGSSTCTNPSRSREVVRDINKFSNNVMARQLYLTLAAEMGGAPARPETRLGIDPPAR